MTPLELNKQSALLSRRKARIVPRDPIQDTINRVCRASGFSFVEIKGKCKASRLVTARIILAHELRKLDLTLTKIAKIMNRCNHGVILYYLKQYEALKEINDKELVGMSEGL